ncbi:prostatic acid phosphatase-like isoform X2 [Littorina saxatilis]|uniref:acid phosphatase n=1 Tax=Littorina saxatilis TaxID=31220 RepID=A0AAN9BQF7_9CAEN
MGIMINFFCLLCLLGASAAAPETLRMVNVLYRHGDRSPVLTYPHDPYQEDAWPQGWGWLSQRGMQQHYELGQWLRSEYGSILNDTYKNTEITVEASNVNRCLMSAYCNLAGLYPPKGTQVWNQKLVWQPIPVHTRPEAEDHKLAIQAPCVRYEELYAKELHSDIIKQEEEENAAFYKLVDNSTGIKRENISEVWKVADSLFCENAHNYTLPNWTQEAWGNGTVYDRLIALKDWSFGLLYNGSALSRLKGGPLVKEFIQNMQTAASDPDHKHYKMYMYSAHDTTVAAVMGAMSVGNHLSPPYATAVLVELHENTTGNYCVQMRVRNDTTRAPYVLRHPACDEDCCPLDKFVEATKDRVPVDWNAECHNPQSGASSGKEVPLSNGAVGHSQEKVWGVFFVGILVYWLQIVRR